MSDFNPWTNNMATCLMVSLPLSTKSYRHPFSITSKRKLGEHKTQSIGVRSKWHYTRREREGICLLQYSTITLLVCHLPRTKTGKVLNLYRSQWCTLSGHWHDLWIVIMNMVKVSNGLGRLGPSMLSSVQIFNSHLFMGLSVRTERGPL